MSLIVSEFECKYKIGSIIKYKYLYTIKQVTI